MAQLTESVARVIDEFAKLPGIGRKSAERLAYHLLRVHKSEALGLADAIRDVRKQYKRNRELFETNDSELPVFGTGWIFWSLVLFGISGLIFVFRALPLQNRLEKITAGGASSGAFDWPGYQELARSWTRWATAAFLVVVGAFVLMVFKPELPVP